MSISRINITITSADPDAEPFSLDVIGTVSMTVNHSIGGGNNDVSLHIDGTAGNKNISTYDGMQKYFDLFNQLIVNYR